MPSDCKRLLTYDRELAKTCQQHRKHMEKSNKRGKNEKNKLAPPLKSQHSKRKRIWGEVDVLRTRLVWIAW